MVFQLIYTSSATPAMNDKMLKRLSHDAALRNCDVGITGMLLFHEGSILQVLEGNELIVSLLFQKIEQDSRHENPLILLKRQANYREFSNWSMGYQNVSGNDNGASLFRLTQRSLNFIMPSSPTPELETITRTYSRVNQLCA